MRSPGLSGAALASFPGLNTTSTRRTLPRTISGTSALVPLMHGSTAGEMIPEMVRHGLQQLIALGGAAVLGADRHERSDD